MTLYLFHYRAGDDVAGMDLSSRILTLRDRMLSSLPVIYGLERCSPVPI